MNKQTRTMRQAVTTAVLVFIATSPLGLVTACSDRDDPQTTAPTPSVPTSSATPSKGTTSAAVAPGPTLGQRIRAVARDRTPDARDIIALAKLPTYWEVGHNRVLVGYGVPAPVDWPDRLSAPSAWQVLDRHGRVLGQWAQRTAYEFVPAGRYFVGLEPAFSRGVEPYGDASRALLVRGGMPTSLTLLPGHRSKRPSELRVDGGWLVDPSRLTIIREELPLCFRGGSRLDSHGRIWCLNREKDQILWSDDGQAWQRHQLSISYFDYCDGGALGADPTILGDVVAVGLMRADFSVDRGDTWWTVSLPVERVGAGPPLGSEQNCAEVSPLPDHRLVVSYFGFLVATDASNTRFRTVATPQATRFVGVQQGVMLAASRSPYGDLLTSYDSGRTWLPLETQQLVRHLLDRTN
jgi:hypothetical protein